MINLLPDEEKEIVFRERLRRAVVVAGFFISVILAVGMILMTPSYFFLSFQERDLVRSLTLSEEGARALETEGLEEKISDARVKFEHIASAAKKKRPISPIFIKIIKSLPGGVRLNSIDYEVASNNTQEKITLSGVAGTRDEFLAFEKRLKESRDFKNVDSPVSNLLSETEIDFNLILDLK